MRTFDPADITISNEPPPVRTFDPADVKVFDPADIKISGRTFNPNDITIVEEPVKMPKKPPTTYGEALSQGITGWLELMGKSSLKGAYDLGESAGLGMQWLGNRSGNEYRVSQGKVVADYFEKLSGGVEKPERVPEGNVVDNPEILQSPEWWVWNVFEQVPNLVATMGPAGAAYKTIKWGGQIIKLTPKVVGRLAKLGAGLSAGTVGGSMEGSQTYKEVLRRTGDEELAARSAELMGFFAGGLNAVMPSQMFGHAGKSLLRQAARVGSSGILEGITEGLEEPAEVFAKVLGLYITDQPLPDNIGEMLIQSAKDGLTVAGPATILGGTAQMAVGQEQSRERDPDINPNDLSITDQRWQQHFENIAKQERPLAELAKKEKMLAEKARREAALEVQASQPAEAGVSPEMDFAPSQAPQGGRVAPSQPADVSVPPDMNFGRPAPVVEPSEGQTSPGDPAVPQMGIEEEIPTEPAAFLAESMKRVMAEYDRMFKGEKPQTEIPRDVPPLSPETMAKAQVAGETVPGKSAEESAQVFQENQINVPETGVDQFLAQNQTPQAAEALKARLAKEEAEKGPYDPADVTIIEEPTEPVKFDKVAAGQYEGRVGNANIDLWKVKKGDWRAEIQIGSYGTANYAEPFTVNFKTKKEAEAEIHRAIREQEDFIPSSQKPKVKKPKAPKGSKVSTLGGLARSVGKIDMGNFKGELKAMTTNMKFHTKKGGMPLDVFEQMAKRDGYLREDEDLLTLMRDEPELFKRRVMGTDTEGRKDSELTEGEKRVKEEEAEGLDVEAPPEGDYKAVDAADLKSGPDQLIIHGKGQPGWGVYTVDAESPFDVELKGQGETIELKASDQVEVLQKKSVGSAPTPVEDFAMGETVTIAMPGGAKYSKEHAGKLADGKVIKENKKSWEVNVKHPDGGVSNVLVKKPAQPEAQEATPEDVAKELGLTYEGQANEGTQFEQYYFNYGEDTITTPGGKGLDVEYIKNRIKEIDAYPKKQKPTQPDLVKVKPSMFDTPDKQGKPTKPKRKKQEPKSKSGYSDGYFWNHRQKKMFEDFEGTNKDRTLKDTLKDVKTILKDEKGAIGSDIGALTAEEKAAYKRLAKDIGRIMTQAQKAGMSLAEYMAKIRIPKGIAMKLEEDAENILAIANSPAVSFVDPALAKEIDGQRPQARETRNMYNDIKAGLERAGGILSTRLDKIHPSLKHALRKMEFKIFRATNKDLTVADDYMTAVKKRYSKEDKELYEMARKNADGKELRRLEKKYRIRKQARALRKVLNEARERALEVGLDMPYLKDYHPRVVKDYQGLREYLRGLQDWGMIEKAIRERNRQLPEPMSHEDEVEFIGNLIRGYGGNLSLGFGHAKKRQIKLVSEEINQFYEDSNTALVSYLNRLNMKIEARRFFGGIPKNAKKLKDMERRVRNRMEKFRGTPKYFLLKARVEGIQESLRQMGEFNVGTSINEYIQRLRDNGTLQAKDEETLITLLRARFNEKGTRGVVSLYKNIAYAAAMGSPISALTQIGDIGLSAYKNGMFLTAKNLPRAMLKISKIKKKDLGFDHIAQEFVGGDWSTKALSKLFVATGLNYIDGLGKETLINASLDRYKKMAKKPKKKDLTTGKTLREKLTPIFEGETDQVIEDIKAGRRTDNVDFLLFSDVLDIQPMAKSETPQLYLESGNGRIFYMLKTYQLKLLDIYRNDIVREFKKPGLKHKKQAAKNLMRVAMLLGLANAGADEIKDWILGRETNFSDKVWDGILRLIGLTKYIAWQARREGIPWAITRLLMPPMTPLEAPLRDIVNAALDPEELDKGLKSTALVPLGGKVYYWRAGAGEKLNEKRKAKEAKKQRAGRKRATRKRPERSNR